MKRLLLILLLFAATLTVNAQLNLHNKNTWKTVGAFAASTALKASADALRDTGHKDWSHALDAASYVPLVVLPFTLEKNDNSLLGNVAVSLGMLGGVRAMEYDYTYNAVHGLPLNHFGNTSVWDKTVGKLGGADGFFMGRVVIFTVTMSFGFKYL